MWLLFAFELQIILLQHWIWGRVYLEASYPHIIQNRKRDARDHHSQLIIITSREKIQRIRGISCEEKNMKLYAYIPNAYA